MVSMMMIAVVAIGAFVLFKTGALNNLGLGGGGGGGAMTGGGGGETAYAGPGGPNIDVAGNGCACSNGVCKGNCPPGGLSTGLNGMSPKEFVKSKVPQAYYTRASPYRSIWGWYS